MFDGLSGIHRQLRKYKRKTNEAEPNKVGKHSGWCAHCSCIMMDGERVCPKCGGVGLVDEAPECVNLAERRYS